MTLNELKSQSVKILSKTSPSPQLDVEVFIEHFAGFSKTQQLLNRDSEIEEEITAQILNAVEKRSTGLPVAYITGLKEFFGYEFFVTPSVLIPKPDTEILVGYAIDIILQKIDSNPDKNLTVCDMCTGSGCIAISIIKNLMEEYEIPENQLPYFTLVDISAAALEIARKNSQSLLPAEIRKHLRFFQSNLFEVISGSFDVILTNPPYIPNKMVKELLKDGRSEPRLALDGDINLFGENSGSDDGLEIIRNLTPQIKEHLAPSGQVIMETGEYNAEQAAAIANLNDIKTELYRDLEGQFRGWIGR